MKIEIDFHLSAGAARAIRWLLLPLAVFGGTVAVAHATIDTKWIQSKQPIPASSLKLALDDAEKRLAALEAAANANPPPGSILAFGGPKAAIPSGWLACDGTALSRTDSRYVALYGRIGTTWGAGDGATTFNLPDLRGYFLRGLDDKSGRDPDVASRTAPASGGAVKDNVGSVQDDAVQTHAHAVSDPGHKHTQYACGAGGGAVTTGGVTFNCSAIGTAGPTESSATGITVGSPSTGRTAAETRPKNANVVYIIKL